jgi:hypothetical protein
MPFRWRFAHFFGRRAALAFPPDRMPAEWEIGGKLVGTGGKNEYFAGELLLECKIIHFINLCLFMGRRKFPTISHNFPLLGESCFWEIGHFRKPFV